MHDHLETNKKYRQWQTPDELQYHSGIQQSYSTYCRKMRLNVAGNKSTKVIRQTELLVQYLVSSSFIVHIPQSRQCSTFPDVLLVIPFRTDPGDWFRVQLNHHLQLLVLGLLRQIPQLRFQSPALDQRNDEHS